MVYSHLFQKRIYTVSDTLTNLIFASISLLLEGTYKKKITLIMLVFSITQNFFDLEHTWWYWIECFILQNLFYYIVHYVYHRSRFSWAIHVMYYNSDQFNITMRFPANIFEPLTGYISS